MSYASIAAQNAPPLSEQPHPDTALLNTDPPTAPSTADDTAKVNVVAPDFRENPQTLTSEAEVIPQGTNGPDFARDEPVTRDRHHNDMNNKDQDRHNIKKRVQQGEAKVNDWCGTITEYLLRPGVAGGLVGLVNIGLLASVGRAFYIRPHLRRDPGVLSSVAAATAALFALESFATKQYRQTPQGKAGEKKLRQRSTNLVDYMHVQFLRPGVLGGAVGLLNASILGTVGYLSYTNWNRPWDRRIVSAVTVGLLALWGGEGYLVENQLNGCRK